MVKATSNGSSPGCYREVFFSVHIFRKPKSQKPAESKI